MQPKPVRTASLKKGKAKASPANENESERETFDLDAVSGSEGESDEERNPKARAKTRASSKPGTKANARRTVPKKSSTSKKQAGRTVEDSDRETFDLDAVSGSEEDEPDVHELQKSTKKKVARMPVKATTTPKFPALTASYHTSTFRSTQRTQNHRILDLYASSSDESQAQSMLLPAEKGAKHCFSGRTKSLMLFPQPLVLFLCDYGLRNVVQASSSRAPSRPCP